MDQLTRYQQYAIHAAVAYKNYTMTEEDTQECAEFLLALKHRSVTPEPQEEPVPVSQFPEPDRVEKTQPSKPRFLIEPKVKKVRKNNYDSDDGTQSVDTAHSEEKLQQGPIDPVWGSLLGGSNLVCMNDRNLVPDPLFVAMAQMKPCNLSESDRVGCYKGRPVGFTGMCCKHCGGQPGFGKYFPATVRSLAQTTTSQTILKHIGTKCRFCPPHIRNAVLELQRQQVIKETTHHGRPRYGSRKVFFQRVWKRLHGDDVSGKVEEDGPVPIAPYPGSTPDHSDDDDDHFSTDTAGMTTSEDESDVLPPKIRSTPFIAPVRKGRFGVLPTKKNLMKRKQLTPPVPAQPAFVSPQHVLLQRQLQAPLAKRPRFEGWSN